MNELDMCDAYLAELDDLTGDHTGDAKLVRADRLRRINRNIIKVVAGMDDTATHTMHEYTKQVISERIAGIRRALEAYNN